MIGLSVPLPFGMEEIDRGGILWGFSKLWWHIALSAGRERQVENGWLILPIFGIALGACVVIWRRRRAGQPLTGVGSAVDAQKEYLLVLLRRTAADLSIDAVEAAANAAWGDRFGRLSAGNRYVEPGSTESVILLQAHGNAFLVIRSDRIKRKLTAPVMFHPESAADLWAEYSDDLSVGVANDYDTVAARLQAYVASLAAALCDEHTIGLFHPKSGQIWRMDPALLDRLRSDPRVFFSAESANS